jgi:hypothetical protein
MKDLLEKLQNNSIPPMGKRWILSTACITHSWNWDIWSKDKLVKKLPVLESKYKRFDDN